MPVDALGVSTLFLVLLVLSDLLVQVYSHREETRLLILVNARYWRESAKLTSANGIFVQVKIPIEPRLRREHIVSVSAVK